MTGLSRPRPAAVGRPAAFFDLDKTIIARSSALAFSRSFYRGGLLNRRSVLRSAYAQFVFHTGGADHDQMEKMRAFLSQMVAGWPVESVSEIISDTLHHIVEPLVYDEAVSLIEDHHLAGRDVVIVSASGSEMVGPIGELLGVDAVIATELAQVEGRYTGEIDFYAYGENKASAMQDLAVERGYDLARSFAYSDSVTDVFMLEAVGHPFAVNPDKALRRIATQNDWPILEFGHAVTLRSRMRLPGGRASWTALAAGSAAVAGTAVYLTARRRLERLA